jgi:alkaline phosphatase
MRVLCLLLAFLPSAAQAGTLIRIVPVDGATLAAGQRFDLRVEATGVPDGPAPSGLVVTVDGRDVSATNILAPGEGGERGRGGTGTPDGYEPAAHRAAAAPAHTTNFLRRAQFLTTPGRHVIVAKTGDGATATATLTVFAWQRPGTPKVHNVILLLGDGMGIAARTAARALSRGYTNGKADGRLAMDTMQATGLVMTSALNAFITDSAPGMASYVTGHKSANNQAGVYPDNTWPARAPGAIETPREGLGIFDNPRVEYLGEVLRRTRGPGFNVGIVTTADLTDATPGANAVHSANRSAYAGIAARFLDERATNGVSVLMGGGRCNFVATPAAGDASTCARGDARDLAGDFEKAGFRRVGTASDLTALAREPKAPARVLGLFAPVHMNVAFDKLGQGTYSDELKADSKATLRDQPLLEDMTRAAIRSLSQHSPKGFYLMVEGASIDKQEHNADAERAIWDVIEFDRAVDVALAFARSTNTDRDPTNDTLVIVTADHESGGLALIGVGNEHYAPKRLGQAVRDYAAVFRFEPDQAHLGFFPQYQHDARGFPVDPDPDKKLLFGWAAAPDRFENWLANRRAIAPTRNRVRMTIDGKVQDVDVPAFANTDRDGATDATPGGGQAIPGLFVPGTIENGATGCAPDECSEDTDTAASAHIITGHTAADVPLSASGPGALTFTGTYDNTEVFRKLLALTGGR